MPKEDTNSVLALVSHLLQEGKIQEADDLLKDHKAELEKEAAAAGAPAPPPEPRPVNEVLRELADQIVIALGSPPELKRLLEELEKSASKES